MFMDEGCGPQFQTTYDHDRAYRNPHITEEPVPGTGDADDHDDGLRRQHARQAPFISDARSGR